MSEESTSDAGGTTGAGAGTGSSGTGTDSSETGTSPPDDTAEGGNAMSGSVSTGSGVTGSGFTVSWNLSGQAGSTDPGNGETGNEESGSGTQSGEADPESSGSDSSSGSGTSGSGESGSGGSGSGGTQSGETDPESSGSDSSSGSGAGAGTGSDSASGSVEEEEDYSDPAKYISISVVGSTVDYSSFDYESAIFGTSQELMPDFLNAQEITDEVDGNSVLSQFMECFGSLFVEVAGGMMVSQSKRSVFGRRRMREDDNIFDKRIADLYASGNVPPFEVDDIGEFLSFIACLVVFRLPVPSVMILRVVEVGAGSSPRLNSPGRRIGDVSTSCTRPPWRTLSSNELPLKTYSHLNIYTEKRAPRDSSTRPSKPSASSSGCTSSRTGASHWRKLSKSPKSSTRASTPANCTGASRTPTPTPPSLAWGIPATGSLTGPPRRTSAASSATRTAGMTPEAAASARVASSASS